MIINQLRQQIKNNLIEMDILLDLMNLEQYQNTNESDNKFNKLRATTQELNEKVNKLVNHLN